MFSFRLNIHKTTIYYYEIYSLKHADTFSFNNYF